MSVALGVPVIDRAKRFVHSIKVILCGFLHCDLTTLPTMATRFIPRANLLTADMLAEFHSNRTKF